MRIVENVFRRFWIEFVETNGTNLPIGISRGCGVSAYSYDDAIQILEDRVFTHGNIPEIANVIEDVDVSSLDEGHVLPNIGNTLIRGVWFPLGY